VIHASSLRKPFANAGIVEFAHAAQVPSLLRSAEVVPAVVLVQGAGAHQPQGTTGDEPAVVKDLVLRLDGHVAHDVEQPQQRLVRRLAPAVGEAQRLAHQRCPTPTERGHARELVTRAMLLVERSVDEDDGRTRCDAARGGPSSPAGT
jgi:hypothetical protein